MGPRVASASLLASLAALSFVGATALGFVSEEYGSLHYFQLGLVGVAAVLWWRDSDRLAAPISPGAWRAFVISSLVWTVTVSLTRFADFRIGAVDFSIFDWMLASTSHGRWGYTPVYELNHFGQHSSFYLLALVPLHALAPSPLWLLLLGPVALWAGLFPLRRLVRRHLGDHGGLVAIAGLAWLSSPWMGRIHSEGFRLEHLVPFASLWFLAAWMEDRRLESAAAAMLLFITKEDSTLYLGSFAVASAALDAGRRRPALLLLVACASWLTVYSGWLQPRLLGSGVGYFGYWSAFGQTGREVVVGMLTHPGSVLERLATSGLWAFFLPLLLLPFTSWRALAGLAPTAYLLGTATYETMHRLQSYYPVPLIAFSVFGVLEFVMRGPTTARKAVAMLALTLFAVVGAGYAKVNAFSVQRLEDVRALRTSLTPGSHVCAQDAVFPHLGYEVDLHPMLDVRCGDVADTWVVVNPTLSVSPLDPAVLEASIQQWKTTRDVKAFGDFLLFAPRRSE